jgi:RNA 2',3'-cyclic 3'-phosphodiesterase
VRLFAAVDLPAEAVDGLAATVGDDTDPLLRYVPPRQWHLTLAFYGEVDDSKLDALHAGLERAAARTRPFAVRLAGAGTFPRQPTKARVVWVGLDGEVDAMRRLADRSAGAGRRARIAMEDRKFRAHLTLARARHGAVDATEAVTPLTSYTGPWWTVSSFRLVRSHLGAEVRHDTIAQFACPDTVATTPAE